MKNSEVINSKVLDNLVRFWDTAYKHELQRYMATREYDRKLKLSGVNEYMVWGFVDEYCFVQGMINAKPMWNQEIFEDRCHQCPMTHYCRFRKVVK